MSLPSCRENFRQKWCARLFIAEHAALLATTPGNSLRSNVSVAFSPFKTSKPTKNHPAPVQHFSSCFVTLHKQIVLAWLAERVFFCYFEKLHSCLAWPPSHALLSRQHLLLALTQVKMEAASSSGMSKTAQLQQHDVYPSSLCSLSNGAVEEWDSKSLRVAQHEQRHSKQVSWLDFQQGTTFSSSRDGSILAHGAGEQRAAWDTCPGSFAGACVVNVERQTALICPEVSSPDKLQLLSIPCGDAKSLPTPGGPLMLDRGNASQPQPQFKQLPAGTAMCMASHEWNDLQSCCVVAYESGILAAYTLQGGGTSAAHTGQGGGNITQASGQEPHDWGTEVSVASMLAMFPSLGGEAAVPALTGSLHFSVGRCAHTGPTASPISRELAAGRSSIGGSSKETSGQPSNGAAAPVSLASLSSISVFSSACTCCDIRAAGGSGSKDLLVICGGVSRELALVKLTQEPPPVAATLVSRSSPAAAAAHAATRMQLLQHVTLPAAGVAAVRWADNHVAAACWDCSIRLFALSDGGLAPTAVLAPGCGRPTCATILRLPADWHSSSAQTSLSLPQSLCLRKQPPGPVAAAAAGGHSSGRLRQRWANQGLQAHNSAALSDLSAGRAPLDAAASTGVSDAPTAARLLVAFDSGRCCLFAFPP